MSNNKDNDDAHWKALGGQEDDFGMSLLKDSSKAKRSVRKNQDLFQEVFGDYQAQVSAVDKILEKHASKGEVDSSLDDFAEFNDDVDYNPRLDRRPARPIQQTLNIETETAKKTSVKGSLYSMGVQVAAKIKTRLDNSFVEWEDFDKALDSIDQDHSVLLPEDEQDDLGKWVELNEVNVIHNRHITKGFFYYLSEKVLFPKNENPALVSKNKVVAEIRGAGLSTKYYSDQSLSYWPSYDKISAQCRGVYLDWLASDRDDPKTPISYVFIYFSGMEYRIITDPAEKSDAEFIEIYKEVIRLYSVYSHNHSFAKYSSNFLKFMKATRRDLIEQYATKNPIRNVSLLTDIAEDVNLIIANKISKEEPITADLAWEWLVSSGRHQFKTPYERLEQEFEFLFEVLFNQEYPKGMFIEYNGSSLHMVYTPSNHAVGRTLFPYRDLPNPTSYHVEFGKIVAIAESVNLELDSLSRYMSKEGNSKDDVQGVILMPKPLINRMTETDSDLKSIKDWAESVVEHSDGLTTTAALWEHFNVDIDDLGEDVKAQDRELKKAGAWAVQLLNKLGFGVAPDKAYHDETISAFESFVLFKKSEQIDFEISNDYHNAKGIISLATPVLKGDIKEDDSINPQKAAKAVMQILHDAFSLSEVQKDSLHAYALWKLTNNSSTIKLKPKKEYFKTFKGSNDAIASLVTGVAFYDGMISKERIAKAEKVYSYMSWDKASLSSIIHNLQTSNPTHGNKKSGAGLDFEKLKRYESETKKAGHILSNVFSSDEDEPATPAVEVKASETVAKTDLREPSIKGLDVAHGELYEKLISKDEWAVSEVEAMCQSLNLMMSAAIEKINDWSFDLIDDAVMEQDDGLIIVDQDSVADLQNTK